MATNLLSAGSVATSPVSAGASEQLAKLIAAIRKDPRAQELLESEDDPGRVLDALRSLDGGTGTAVTDSGIAEAKKWLPFWAKITR